MLIIPKIYKDEQNVYVDLRCTNVPHHIQRRFKKLRHHLTEAPHTVCIQIPTGSIPLTLLDGVYVAPIPTGTFTIQINGVNYDVA